MSLLEKELGEMEMDFNKLDNMMEELGFYSEGEILANENTMDEILTSGVISYTRKEDNENVLVNFVVIYSAGVDENTSATIIRVTSVNE